MKLDMETLQELVKSGELQKMFDERANRLVEKQVKPKVERPRTRRAFKYRDINFIAIKEPKGKQSHIYIIDDVTGKTELGTTVPVGMERKAAIQLANIYISNRNIKRLQKGRLINEDGQPLA